MVRKRALHYEDTKMILLRNFCAILKKANKKANHFCGLGRTMPNASKIF
jgi:hypothetical protein